LTERGGGMKLGSIRRSLALGALALLAGSVTLLSGCAWGGEDIEPVIPSVVIDLVATYNAPIQDRFYYYIALDAGGDFGATGPVPVAAGPNWGNGWGTGSITHYVEYHAGRYELFRATFDPELEQAGGGITAVSGIPDSFIAGVHTITINALNPGAATVQGDGAIAAVQNASFQAAGSLTISTTAAGEVVAGSIAWSPAAAGSRPLTAAEQAQVDALNAGGVQLTEDALGALGLTLALSTEADLSGDQVIEIAPTTALVTDRFNPDEPAAPPTTTQSTLPANNRAVIADGPIPGLVIVTGDLVPGGTAQIRLLPGPVGQSLGFPFQAVLPNGGRSLRVTLDLRQLGADVPNLSVNFISTTELIFSAVVVNPDENTYDALGPLGNDYVTFPTNEFTTIQNGDFIPQEGAGDPTLVGRATVEERAAVDLVDWSITTRRLR
jgi:hypothetical protein